MTEAVLVTRIRAARSDADIAAVRGLFEEYAELISDALDPIRYADEMTNLAERYDVILLAEVDGAAVAAVAVRPLADDICEMKRLYTQPAFRGRGLGRTLCGKLFEEARARGYRWMRLDTLDWLTEALSLYRSLGFVKIAPYNDTRLAGLIHMEKTL